MPKSLKHPAAISEWRDNLRKSSLKLGFQLMLSRPMLEYLCAVADDVLWDRGLNLGGIHFPDNWLASQNSLVKRGLIERKSPEEFAAQYPNRGRIDGPRGEWSTYKLTPAGKAVVELVKLAGVFVEADAAINKKSRRG